MRFSMGPYLFKFIEASIDKGVWADHTWEESFNGLGFSSYKYCGYEDSNNLPHYLSEDEFLIFVLRYI